MNIAKATEILYNSAIDNMNNDIDISIEIAENIRDIQKSIIENLLDNKEREAKLRELSASHIKYYNKARELRNSITCKTKKQILFGLMASLSDENDNIFRGDNAIEKRKCDSVYQSTPIN